MAPRNHQLILLLLLIYFLTVNSSLEVENEKLQNSSLSNAKFKSAISDLLQNYKPSLSGKQALKVKALHDVMRPIPGNLLTSDQYKCAKYCACSVIQIVDKSKNEKRANLTQAKCESAHFSDVLTIDRRTQIIHISLPQESAGISGASATFSNRGDQSQAKSFRMPRLVQFNILREIVIINLKFEVCDSEVFKRGQRLRRFQLNYNQLNRISKACLRHLEKLIELNLDNNKLEELESALFSNLISLKSLSIAHNQLSELAAHQFANLTNLVSLNLVGNSFKTINLHLFEPMQNSLRLLLLAKNQIKSFVHSPNQQQQSIPISTILLNANTNSSFSINKSNATSLSKSLFSGVVFKNLVKLNVNSNKLERIKQLQLHRFFNIKYLSIRHNNIATIRDKAFNGLKLIELNLAHNQLQSISKCSFCNATIKRLVLSNNNISLPLPSQTMLLPEPSIPRPQANVASNESLQLPNPLAQSSGGFSQQQEPPPEATSSQNMLILSQSIFGPLFGQLEYLDLSSNQMLADQLDFLLEPLLKLEYLNIASVGLDRSLSSPTLFKNLRQLRYLNLSHNQLDQLIAETVEPLTSLEALDMSYNKFSELDESFLVTIDELTTLKIINFGNNPWFCSQCKVAPLYDWILRSPIYNQSCIAPTLELQELRYKQDASNSDQDQESDSDLTTEEQVDGLTYNPHVARGPQDYNLLISEDDKTLDHSTIDFDLILGNSLFEGDSYNLLDGSDPQQQQQQTNWGFRDLANSEDDSSISHTMAIVSSSEPMQFNPLDYCLKCEFPRELQTFNIHELSSGDFKFCAGATPRFMASEPKIGLTLAIVIIGALFCIIIVVIVMYRRKSNTYYTNEDTDHLEGGEKQVRSMSSDIDHQYGDATDYSSPPMSQSYESYSQEDEEDERDEEEDDLEDEDEEEDEEDEVNGNSARDSIGRRAAAEEERRHQLAEYNQRSEHKTSKGSQSIKSNQSRASPATSGSISRKTDRKSEASMHSSGSTKQRQQRAVEKPLWGEASLESKSTHDAGPLNELMMKSALKSSPSSSSQVATPAKAVSKDSTRDQADTHAQERGDLSRKLESDGSFKHRRLVGSRDGPVSEFDYEATRSAGSSQKPVSKVDRHRAVRSSQTIYQLSYGLRPQSNTARSQSSANASNPQKSSLPSQTSGKQRATFSQLSRQRFAQSKEASEPVEPGQLDKTAVMDVQLLEPTRRADFLHMVHQDRVHTPSGASDATTADSIALEALDYLPSDLEDLEEPQPGGALEMNSSSPEGEPEDRQHHPYNNCDYLQL